MIWADLKSGLTCSDYGSVVCSDIFSQRPARSHDMDAQGRKSVVAPPTKLGDATRRSTVDRNLVDAHFDSMFHPIWQHLYDSGCYPLDGIRLPVRTDEKPQVPRPQTAPNGRRIRRLPCAMHTRASGDLHDGHYPTLVPCPVWPIDQLRIRLDKQREDKRTVKVSLCYTDIEDAIVSAEKQRQMRQLFDTLTGQISMQNVGSTSAVAFGSHMKKFVGLRDAHTHRLLQFFKIPDKIRFPTYLNRFRLFCTTKVTVKQQLCFHLLDIDGDGILSPHDLFAILHSVGTDDGRYAIQHGGWTNPMAFKEVSFQPWDDIGVDIDKHQNPPEVVRADHKKMGYRNGIRVGDRFLSLNGCPLLDSDLLEETLGRANESELVFRLCTYDWARRNFVRDGFMLSAVCSSDFECLWRAYLSKVACGQNSTAGLTLTEFHQVFGDTVPGFYVTLAAFFVGERNRSSPSSPIAPKKRIPSCVHQIPEDIGDYWIGTTEAYRTGLLLAFTQFATEGELYIEREYFKVKSRDLFGFSMPSFSDRMFDLLACDSVVVTLEMWARSWTIWSYSPLHLAFTLYDMDDDGIISVDDVENLRSDANPISDRTERHGANEETDVGEASAFWTEVQWLFSYVCEKTLEEVFHSPRAPIGISLGLFMQLLPQSALLKQLQVGIGFDFSTRN